MNVHLVDGTYELFRAYHAHPSATAPDGREVGATRGFLRIMSGLLRNERATHIACAFDTVIESFRNELFPGYKTGEGLSPALTTQFPLVERASRALGFVTWSMIEFEADDALAAAAAMYAMDPRVERIFVCSPDKDLAQCVRGDRIVMLDRSRKRTLDENAVIAKFGVPPSSIPDWLALVGDTADGYPGIPRWGARSAATLLAHYGHVEDIPDDPATWTVKIRGAEALATSLAARRTEAMLYRHLATLRTDVPLAESLDDTEWRGVDIQALESLCAEIGERTVLEWFKPSGSAEPGPSDVT